MTQPHRLHTTPRNYEDEFCLPIDGSKRVYLLWPEEPHIHISPTPDRSDPICGWYVLSQFAPVQSRRLFGDKPLCNECVWRITEVEVPIQEVPAHDRPATRHH